MPHFVLIVGARPNFMKIAPILRALEAYPAVRKTLVHTGQHYDPNLSDVFFQELGIAAPQISLGVGSGSHGRQTADVLVGVEKVLQDFAAAHQPVDRLVVVGDVNSTLAATLAAAKLNIPVAHVEAGLRSRDRTMPEEVNRIVTDALADLLLVSEPEGVANLLREGHSAEQIHLVGNVMIDTLRHQVAAAAQLDTLAQHGLQPRRYCVVTLHRPSNVDDRQTLSDLIRVLADIAAQMQVVFPVHPRTQRRLEEFGLWNEFTQTSGVVCLPPLGYLEFLNLTRQAQAIVTDSGGLQEESTALGVPCLTMRENTERPITVSEGTSTLIGRSARLLHHHLEQILAGQYKTGRCPELWDGRAAERIARVLWEKSVDSSKTANPPT